MSRVFTSKSILTSQKMPDGKRYDFKPGKAIEEKFIYGGSIESYLSKGLITEVDAGNAKVEDATAVKPKKASTHKKSKARQVLDSQLADNVTDKTNVVNSQEK